MEITTGENVDAEDDENPFDVDDMVSHETPFEAACRGIDLIYSRTVQSEICSGATDLCLSAFSSHIVRLPFEARE